jgi:hypothetical protein
VAGFLLLTASEAQAQSRGGSGGCGRGGSGGSRQQNTLRYTPQQYTMLTAAQQQALLTALQQQQQQQQALLAALQQQQNALRAQQRNAAAVQPRAVQMPESKEPVPSSESPEQTGARQLKIARWLVSDANTAQQRGERDVATRLRDRAGERLQDVVAQYAGTKAADAAQDLLQQLRR